jgi:transposase-like protein
MTINHQPKVAMHAANNAADPSERLSSDAEVVPRARRRQFSSADKQRILQAVDNCTKPGEIGALMRREGVYSSSLSTWRRQRETADLAALAPVKRGPKTDPHRAQTLHIAQLTSERDSLQSRLDKALLVIDVQKKLAALLGNSMGASGGLL